MGDIRRHCKWCNSAIVVSDREDGYYHAFEVNGNLHKCRSKGISLK